MRNDKHTDINTDLVEKVSFLAQLSLTEEEKILAGEDMSRMLDFFARLSAWDENRETSGEERSGVHETEKITQSAGNILRRDEVTNKEDNGGLLANAPLQKDGMFVVPLSISDGK